MENYIKQACKSLNLIYTHLCNPYFNLIKDNT